MDTEIELKFLVSEHAAIVLPQLVEQFSNQRQGRFDSKGQKHLSNTYFDTPDKLLRQHDIGFRVRSVDGQFEQTVKTAGKVVAGLHSRPEFNMDLADENPRLDWFDAKVFGPTFDAPKAQEVLIALFTTDFNRTKWLLSCDGEQFELVYDLGEVRSGEAQSVISEVELELVSGDGGLMFAFAELLSEHLAPDEAHRDQYIRLGLQSKAARGYQLYNQSELSEIGELGPVTLVQADSLETAFIKTMEYGLYFIQHHEQCFIDKPNLLALRRFADGAALLRHALWLFSEVVDPDEVAHFRAELKWILTAFGWVEHAKQLQVLKSHHGKFRKKLDKNKALAQLVKEEAKKDPDLDDIKRFFSDKRYVNLLLQLSRWVMMKSWRQSPQFNLKETPPGTLHEVAGDLLGNAWQSLLKAMPKKKALTIDDYMFHHKQLKRSLLTGSSFGGLYLRQLRDEFRLPWLDLSQGIDELKTLGLLKSLAMKLDHEQGGKTLDWLDGQLETLLLAMEQSRRSAIKMKTYWSL